MVTESLQPVHPRVRTEFLPFALPDIDESELDEIREVLNGGWVTTGPKTRQFEQSFATAVGAKHAIAVNSCTAAMHLALEAIGLTADDFVVTTPYTFAATAEVIRYFGATPVFVDVEADTFNIDPKCLVEIIEDLNHSLANNSAPQTIAVTRALASRSDTATKQGKLKAIMPVHFAGLPVELDTLYEIAEQYGLAVIEDAAHAFPSRFKSWTIGQDLENGHRLNVPRLICFSFYATKTITTGEGGMICTSDTALADRCRIMALHGISRDAWKRYTAEGSWYYEVLAPGYKYNMTDVASAMGVAQLRKANGMWERRCAIAQRYNDAFQNMPELQIPADRSDSQHSWHLYILRLNLDKLNVSRAQFIEELKARKIGTSVHFIPLHTHPYYRNTYGYQQDDFPVAESQYQRVISLPIYSKMSDSDVEDVIHAVTEVVQQWQMA